MAFGHLTTWDFKLTLSGDHLEAGLKQGEVVDSVDDMSFRQLSLLAVADRVAQRDPASVVLSLKGRQVGRCPSGEG